MSNRDGAVAMAGMEAEALPMRLRLLQVARHELAGGGTRALGLRRIAAAAGVTLATLSYHLGSKAQLMQALVDAERERDRLWHADWLACMAAVPRWDAPALATMLEQYLQAAGADDAHDDVRVTRLVWAELMLHAGVDPATAALLQPWLQDRRRFWQQLLAARIDDEAQWSELLFAYASDEGVHALALEALPDYRLLRRLAIERLSHGLHPLQRVGLASTTAVFEVLVQRLDPALGLATPEGTSPLLEPGRRRDIAVAACEVILEEGAQALTHRAVAERLGIPASSVAYHCRTGADLLIAGQEMVYLVAQGRMPAPRDDSATQRQRVTMRGTLSISLAAARDPVLRPHALDLRRLRGENLARLLREGDHRLADRLDAQAAAITGLGAAALSDAEGGDRQRPGQLLEWQLRDLSG
ncbi:TPA: TetR family transcriptional regulator [Stenotrophomonas maltophilia]